MIYVRGAESAIAQALNELVPIRPVLRGSHMPLDGTRYLFCVGLIRQKRVADQTEQEIKESFDVNYYNVVNECDRLLELNPRARICVIGSESAFKGSFDETYANAKAALHQYVVTTRLRFPDQQLVCVAPTCVVGTKMNQQRNPDGVAALERRRVKHPKMRWLSTMEVARMIHFLLCVDEGYTTNVVIRMNGGEHANGS